jgi:hypothetical protein
MISRPLSGHPCGLPDNNGNTRDVTVPVDRLAFVIELIYNDN